MANQPTGWGTPHSYHHHHCSAHNSKFSKISYQVATLLRRRHRTINLCSLRHLASSFFSIFLYNLGLSLPLSALLYKCCSRSCSTRKCYCLSPLQTQLDLQAFYPIRLLSFVRSGSPNPPCGNGELIQSPVLH